MTAGGGAWLNPLIGYYLGINNIQGLGAAYDTLLPYTNEADTLTTMEVNRNTCVPFRTGWNGCVQAWGSKKRRNIPVPSAAHPLGLQWTRGQLGQVLAPGETDPIEKKIGFWLNGFSQFGRNSTDGFTGFNYTMAGACAGLDYAFSDRFVAGLGGGYANTDLGLSGNWGHSNTNSYFANVYGTYFTDKADVEGVLSYGKHQYYPSFYQPRK